MSVLLDLIEPGLKTLFCGSAASTTSARRKAYYAGPGNRFWSILQQTCMTPRLFESKEYRLLADLGIGLTDLAKHEFGMDEDLSTAAYDVQGLIKKVENARAAYPCIHRQTSSRYISAGGIGGRLQITESKIPASAIHGYLSCPLHPGPRGVGGLRSHGTILQRHTKHLEKRDEVLRIRRWRNRWFCRRNGLPWWCRGVADS